MLFNSEGNYIWPGDFNYISEILLKTSNIARLDNKPESSIDHIF